MLARDLLIVVRTVLAAAVLDITYIGWFGPGCTPQQKATFTIAPPPASAMIGIVARHSLNGASTLIAIESAKSLSLASVIFPRVMTPALLTRISRPPIRSCTCRGS